MQDVVVVVVVVLYFPFFVLFFFFRFLSSEKSRNCPRVFDMAYQLLTHHSPFAPLCQIDE